MRGLDAPSADVYWKKERNIKKIQRPLRRAGLPSMAAGAPTASESAALGSVHGRAAAAARPLDADARCLIRLSHSTFPLDGAPWLGPHSTGVSGGMLQVVIAAYALSAWWS